MRWRVDVAAEAEVYTRAYTQTQRTHRHRTRATACGSLHLRVFLISRVPMHVSTSIFGVPHQELAETARTTNTERLRIIGLRAGKREWRRSITV